MLETKDLLFQMLDQASKLEFSISIGNENAFDEMKKCSVVTATYSIDGKTIGSFGVIGPTRMNYARVVSVLDQVGKGLNTILSGFIDDGTPKDE